MMMSHSLLWPFSKVAAGMLLYCFSSPGLVQAEILTLDNGVAKVGIGREHGAAIAWLSWAGCSNNAVNVADPGRLIQQSYYAGKSLDRTAEGQSKHWSPWSWNPIQGGGVSSWAHVNVMESQGNGMLYGETVPKLWDMPDEPATALIRQWTSFETDMPNVVRVQCELISQRNLNDRWGAAVSRSQEIPACYFNRAFDCVKTYLGDDRWEHENLNSGPPWNRRLPPRRAMAFFNASGQGVALFSPAATNNWNCGPCGEAGDFNSAANPCMHLAAIARVRLGPKSDYRYCYWLVVENEQQIASRLEVLWQKYSGERAQLSDTINSAERMPSKVAAASLAGAQALK